MKNSYLKNIPQEEILSLASLVDAQAGQVVSKTLAQNPALSVTLFAPLLPSEAPWHWPTGLEWAGLVIATGFLTIGYQTAVAVMRVGEVGFVSPFRYTSLLWAIALGYLVFGNLPDRWTLLGATIVVGAGIFTLLRERRLRRSQA